MHHGARLLALGSSLTIWWLALGCAESSYDMEMKRSCLNKELDKGESDVDCGGGGCNPCEALKLCSSDKNCTTGLLCVLDPSRTDGTKRCQATHCVDSKLNSGETDVDCGGKCWPCSAGQGCGNENDCESHVCNAGLCLQATCSDGRLNQDEADVDCGATLTPCPACRAGGACTSNENCESKLCVEGKCKAATCSDAVQNGDEGGVDCGGASCKKCGPGSSCLKDTDCASEACRAGACVAAACNDGVKNGDESATDCGGSCPKCIENTACNTDRDCTTDFCYASLCKKATCDDKIKNQGESDTDCGDPRNYCPKCAATQICSDSSQCLSGNCVAGYCAERTCSDHVKNGLEGDVDCGSACGNLCADGATCREMTDCTSKVCDLDGRCAVATCGDAVKNGLETDKNCGGNCQAKCSVGQGCSINADCQENSCNAGICATPLCPNGMQDGAETDIDCGGAACGACEVGMACKVAADCISKSCIDQRCAAPNCNDAVKNGSETDVDCGGSCEQKCPDQGPCLRAADCQSGVCLGGFCQAPTCTDGVHNGKETAKDCGGEICLAQGRKCEVNATCLTDADCKTSVCNPAKGTCEPQSCSDGRQNQDETDVDCGGSQCGATCKTGEVCVGSDDCADHRCVSSASGSTCAEARCDDGVQNGLEGGTDCGEVCPKLCPVNSQCKSDTDCAEQVCAASGSATKLCQKPSCTDGKKNGTELDVDCGPVCGAGSCAAGQHCATTADCNPKTVGIECKATPGSGANTCVPPNCFDKVKGGGETDTDCGGPECSPCAAGKACESNDDCDPVDSGRCTNIDATTKIGTCASAACDDGVKNGAESGTDCGGEPSTKYPACKRCPPQFTCTRQSDCDNVRCDAGVCQSPSCSDGLLNGSEPALDCGATCLVSTGKLCEVSQKCDADVDCASGWCDPTNKVCKSRSCTDGVKNGPEGDVDCGAICNLSSKLCPIGKGCNKDADCLSGQCSECTGKCIPEPQNCLKPNASNCIQCELLAACSNDFDCKSLNCNTTTGQCAAADKCVGKILTGTSGLPALSICPLNASQQLVGDQLIGCFGYLRCMYYYGISPTHSYFTSMDTPCGQNKSGFGGATPHDAARFTWQKVPCAVEKSEVSPTNVPAN